MTTQQGQQRQQRSQQKRRRNAMSAEAIETENIRYNSSLSSACDNAILTILHHSHAPITVNKINILKLAEYLGLNKKILIVIFLSL